MALALLAAPAAHAASDDCASATPVTEGVFPYDTTDATDDGPNPCSSVGFKNVWLAYTPTAAGNVTVSTCGSDFDADDQQSVIAVYGGSCAAIEIVTCSFSGCGIGSSATFVASVGETYLIQIGGGCEDCTSSGLVTIVNDALPPANDACAAAAVITIGARTISNVGATLDGSSSCIPTTGDIWFTFTAPASGLAEISTCGSAFDSVVTVYEGAACPPTGPELACGDDDCRTQASAFVEVTGGQTYLIQVAGSAFAFRDPAFGVGRLSVRILNPPANDLCANATPVAEGVFPVTNVDALTDGPVDCEDPFADVWFRYTPTVTGLARITASGQGPFGDWNTIVAVYTGDCDLGLEQIACNNDYASVAATAHAPVQAGVPVLILVAGNGGEPGSGDLTIETTPAPANDDCVAAVPIGLGLHPFTTRGATTDGPFPACALPSGQVFSDVWFLFTSPGDGDVTFSLCGSLFDTLLAVYPGPDCPDGVFEIICDDDSCSEVGPSLVTIRRVVSGQQLLIRIGGFEGATGDGVLSASIQAPSCDVVALDGMIFEAEDCGAAVNDGCAGEPAQFQVLTCQPSQVIYGNAFAANGLRDTDWYRITLPAPATVTWDGVAEFPAVFSIRNGVCQGDELARAIVQLPCSTAVATIRLPAGTYNLTVAPADFWSGAVCDDGSEYNATLEVVCEPTGGCCVAGACTLSTLADCAAAGGTYLGDNAACDNTTYLISTCDSTFESIESTGQEGPQCDGCQVLVPLGFEFTFYGRGHTQAYVNANGFLSFGPVGLQGNSPHPLPRNWNPNALIAPFWSDLASVFAGNVRYQTVGLPGARRFIAQWTGVQRFFETDASTFQAILHEADGTIEFRYAHTAPTLFDEQTVIGVEDHDGARASTFDPFSPLDGRCLRFTPFMPGPICPPTCTADFNNSGSVTVQDIFDFLAAYFSANPTADINGQGGITVQDIFDFLTAYFAGC